MRWAFTPPLGNVNVHCSLGVDGKPLVGVDGNTEKTRVCIDQLILIPNNRIPQDTSIIEICQAGHVFRAVKLGRIDLANLVLLENFFLWKKMKTFFEINRRKKTESFVNNFRIFQAGEDCKTVLRNYLKVKDTNKKIEVVLQIDACSFELCTCVGILPGKTLCLQPFHNKALKLFD